MYFLSISTSSGVLVVLVVILIVLFIRSKTKKKEPDHNEIYESIKSSSPVSIPEENNEKETDEEDEQVSEEDSSDDSPVFPLEQLSEDYDTPVWVIMSILDLPFKEVCTAITAQKAEEEFYAAEAGSEKEYVAFIKWVELEEDIEKSNDLYDFAVDIPYLDKFVDDRMSILALRKLESLSEEQELHDLMDEVSNNSPAEKAIFQKLLDLYKKS